MTMISDRWSRLREFVQTVPRNVKLFLLTTFAYGAAVEGISAVLLNLYLLRLGYGTEFIGTLNSAGLFVFALVSLPMGAVQRISRRQMLLIGQALSLLGLVGLPLARYFPLLDEAVWLIIFRIVAMIGLSAYFVYQIPFSMDIVRKEWHSRIMAWTMAVFSFAAFVGSWIGGLLPEWFARALELTTADPEPFQWSMLLASAMLIPSLVLLFLISERPLANDVLETSNKQDGEANSTKGWRALAGLVALILVIRALQTSGVGVMITFSNVYLDDALQVSTSRIGLISGFGRLLGVPLSLTIPWLVNRFGNFRLVILSLIGIVILIVPIALFPLWQVAAVGVIAINSMGSLRYLSFVSFTMSLVPDEQRSLISGAGEMAIGAGFAASSFVGGYMIAWYGYRELFLFSAAVTLVGTGLFAVVFWRRAQAQAVQAEPAV